MTQDAEGGDSRERHEPYEWHEPTGPHGPENHPTHAGNGTVNHGPDEDDRKPDGTKDDEREPDGRGDPGGTGESGESDGSGAPDGFGGGELELRRLLHRAVDDVEPRDGALEHLRRAVPARRTRKRQAAVGMAAAFLFVGTAVPALLHVSNSVGSSADPSIAGNASQAQGGAGQNAGSDDGRSNTAASSGQASEKGGTDGKKDRADTPSGAGSGTAADGDDPSTAAAGAADCAATQLGSGTTTLGDPDSVGTVYGSFRVTNISTTGCTVTDPGTVTALTQGAADATRVSVAEHVVGDAATGLPDPAQQPARLLLLPGAAYEVKFAWVPSETCPTSSGTVGGDDGDTGGATPDPSPSGDGSATSGTSTGGDTGITTELVPADGTLDGSVVVSHTPQAGAPPVSVTVPNACAGTVFRTGMLAES